MVRHEHRSSILAMSQIVSLSLSSMTTSVERTICMDAQSNLMPMHLAQEGDGPTYLVGNTVSLKGIVSIETATNVIASTTREYRSQDYS
ncbi:hypothetical protein AUEXF2481DRAFT_518967 [Aureobasidium subglaciale EXF-2481]|uniref:Uncharacterized protein n=1 Tax=Aureobasidium subglaciale (strain EXF-2481) TaxID=1043005 RepID=A0A074Y4U5_AURSE|nr:uncharacterized protein AUEXF2481DRAFT_518967 [Aureobasidium subglaciale EXF-2481]KEQ90974.1 hypothetical protein AUEXF2481DRAFT_518967 [Aureobasidium subglaciale EXF-2481]